MYYFYFSLYKTSVSITDLSPAQMPKMKSTGQAGK